MDYEVFARRLLIGVYYPVSAVTETDAEGRLLSVTLFDTEFGHLPVLLQSGAKEICLFTNHPEGRQQLYEKDRCHISRLRALYPHVSLRVLITNEDFICREYALLPAENV